MALKDASGQRDPLIGQVLHNYVIREKLAEGGMGAVYVAEHERLPVKKVVKVLLAEYSHNAVIRQRFEREAEAAARLRRRHIISIENFGALPDGQLYLMMPLLEGRTLEKHIQLNQRLTLHHTLHIMVQVCRALQDLHDAGIIHRDLKPGNIFISEADENPRGDLGIARDLREDEPKRKTQTGLAMGTPGYMAVEQYGHAASVTETADIYAAGGDHLGDADRTASVGDARRACPLPPSDDRAARASCRSPQPVRRGDQASAHLPGGPASRSATFGTRVRGRVRIARAARTAARPERRRHPGAVRALVHREGRAR